MPFPYPMYDGGTTVVVGAPENCVVTDGLGRLRLVPCDIVPALDAAAFLAMSGDEVTVVDEVTPKAPTPIIRQGIRIGAGRLNPGSTPYYQFAAQARNYPFDWHGRPGGVPSSRVAAESRQLGLAGSGDLYESGLNPYTIAYPALAHRGFTLPGRPLAGFLDDLSTNEKRLLGLAAAGGLAYFLLQQMKRKRRGARAIVGRRRNPSPRRGRRRRRRTRRR
jgi:hypothetical protein